MPKKFLIIITFICFISFVKTPAHAFVVGDPCNITYESFKLTDVLFSPSAEKTTSILGTALGTVLIPQITGMSIDETVGCDTYIMAAIPADKRYTEDFTCGGTDPALCEEFINASGGSAGKGYLSSPSTLSLRQKGIRGSLLGMAYALEDLNYEEPLAVNFAYFWNRNAQKLPIVGKAFAANESGYNLPMLDAAYGLWGIVRNVSLALMSIILLYTGIMIIMRKKVNPQLVVSVQYAIPKIVIGLLLIVFSYAIGAAIVGISWGLFRSASSIVANLGGLSQGHTSQGQLFAAVWTGTAKSTMGVGRIITLLITGLAMLIMSVVVHIKATLIYLKMVISVITAPFEITLGTVPGSEATIMNWFKKMAKMGLTIFAMGLIIPAVLVLAYEILLAYRPGGSPETAGFGVLLRVLVPPLVVIYGYSLAFGMEKTVGSLFGEDKRKY